MTTLRTYDEVTGTVTTTDAATTTTVVSYTVPSGAVAFFEFELVGRDGSGNGAVARYVQGAKNVAGTVSLFGTITGLLTFATGSSATLATSVLSADVSGTAVRLRVAGILATSIEWIGRIKATVN